VQVIVKANGLSLNFDVNAAVNLVRGNQGKETGVLQQQMLRPMMTNAKNISSSRFEFSTSLSEATVKFVKGIV
jgi:hypothetical protein